MGKLSRDELRSTIKALRSLSETLFDEILDLLDSRDTEDFRQLVDSKRDIDEKIRELTLAIFDDIMVDIEEPRQQIKLSINRVEFSIKSLQNMNHKLQILRPIINLLDTIITATKTLSVANIGVIVDQIEGAGHSGS